MSSPLDWMINQIPCAIERLKSERAAQPEMYLENPPTSTLLYPPTHVTISSFPEHKSLEVCNYIVYAEN